ncbi:hypothetical protein LCL95_04635 [Bacillus timonensis]|nr:hypothetical protein [Bacillus timonensis]
MIVRNMLFVFLIKLFVFSLVGCSSEKVFTEEDCTDVFIPCVNAHSSTHSVKVLNGSSSLKVGGQHSESHADLDSLDKDSAILRASKSDKITLEFINKTPLSLMVYDGTYSSKEVLVDDLSFVLPDETGIYVYEIYAKYSNGGVIHYLKVEVK